MKAAIFSGPRRVRVVDVETPKIASNEVLIKTQVAGICGTDLHFYSGKNGALENLIERMKTTIAPYKIIMGHEFSGFVTDKGNDANDIELNERVTAWPIIPCHECKYCKMGFTHLCENRRLWPGAFSEFIKVPLENVIKIPAKLSYEEAAMLEPIACAIHAVKLAEIEKHHSIFILGAGTMGLLVLQVARSFGVEKILVTDVVDFRLEMAKKLGADIAMNATKVDSYEKKTLMKDLDVAFECSGSSASTINQAIDLIDKRGTIMVFGSFTSPPQINLLKFRQKELAIIGSEASQKIDFLDGINLLTDGKVKVQPLITHKFPLESIRNAFEVALGKEKTKSIKVQIIL
jgi:L-iditol 2-dehydrogenase